MPLDNQELTDEEIVSVFRMRLPQVSPFFTVLAFSCRFTPTKGTGIVACTDGRYVYFDGDLFRKFTSKERIGVFIHELLHVAYAHVIRRGTRDPYLWNLAADLYINQIIAELDFCTLPEGGVLEPDFWRETTEEIYELLKQNPDIAEKYKSNAQQLQDLIEGAGDLESDSDNPNGKPTKEDLEIAAKMWEQTLEVAKQEQINKSDKFGKLPNKLGRTLEQFGEPQIDWRTALTNYLVRCPNDYEGFDRRFISQGIYEDSFEGSSIKVAVCIDTSGSIGNDELAVFAAELNGILKSYPQVDCFLYWADTNAYGPYPINHISELPAPEGGGGTCFKDFFNKLQEPNEVEPIKIAVYLTDGYGSFPNEPPADIDTLWVVTSNGLPLKKFPFGTAVQLKD